MTTRLLSLASLLFSLPMIWGEAPATAEPGPPPAAEKSPALAFGLSAGVTALSLAAIRLDPDDDGWLSEVGLLGVWLGPSTGTAYAGKYLTGGLVLRTVGMLAVYFAPARKSQIVASATASSAKVAYSGDPDVLEVDGDNAHFIIPGLLAIVGGMLWDFAAGPNEVRRANRLVAAPIVLAAPDRPIGLGVAVTF